MSDIPVKHLIGLETKRFIAIGLGSVIAAFLVVEVVMKIHHLF